MERPDPMIGRVLDGRYRIEDRVARGGMATVYEAHDLRLDRVCAVKVMHTDLGDDHDFGARFVREAHAAARLSHPNVVAVSDQGDDDGVLFLVMELVPGRTLRDVIRDEAPLPPARALALLEPVLMALAEAHRSGLIHRDVKPENVLIADDGRVKVADFGLARAFDANSQHTATGGLLIGTVSYLAPELITSGRSDPRSDVYAAGVLLYEMLTGLKPHAGEGAVQIAFKHVNEDVPPPSEATDQPIPAYVDALVLRATARDRERRPADAKVFLHHARRVRAAVEAGELDDDDLTADLLPTVVIAPVDGIDYTDEPDATLADLPAAPAAPATPWQDREATEVIGPLVDPVITPLARQVTREDAPDDRTDDRTDDTGDLGLGGAAAASGATTGAAAGATATAVSPAVPARPTLRRGRTGGPTGPSGPSGPSGPQEAHGGPSRPRRSRRGPVLLLLVVLLTALTAWAGWWVGIGRYTSTPGVINLSVAAATDKLEAAGLDLAVAGREFSETVPAGSVMATDPAAGSRILEGDTVEATVSRGPERYAVPTLRGETLDDAEALLAEENLVLGEVTRAYDENVPEGVVVSADPPGGTELRRDTAVSLVVSRGPEPIRIPDLTGRDGERAEQRLTRLGFEVTVTEENSDDVEEGLVISQDPADGTGFRDDEIALVVSKGPVLVTVPSLSTDSVGEATEELEAVGLAIAVERTQFYIGLDTVVRQSVGAGELVPKGSTVTVFVV